MTLHLSIPSTTWKLTEAQITLNPGEEARWVPGFPGYVVTSHGRVFRGTGIYGWSRPLKPDVGHKGHLRVTLFRGGIRSRELVHRLVLKTFDRAPLIGEIACHWDDDPSNNRIENLRWGTPKDNKQDAARNGRVPSGAACHFARLTEEQAIEVCHRVARGDSRKAIAIDMDIDVGSVSKIVTGVSWKYLDVPRQPPKHTAIKRAPEVIDGALAMVRAGSSVNRASQDTGVNRKTITRLLRGAPSEKQIHAAVMDHWRVRSVPGSLVATMANEFAHGQPGLTRGLFDLLVIAPGLPCAFLELKTTTGKLSEHQRAFGDLCTNAGVLNAVAYGLDQALDVLVAWGVIRSAANDGRAA